MANAAATPTEEAAENAIRATTSRACSLTRRGRPGTEASVTLRPDTTLGAVGVRLIGSTPLDGA